MGIGELFVLAVGLSMDAFAVSVCKGLSLQRITFKNAGLIGLYFGLFQAGMPLIGYFLGSQFASYITSYDHWIAFGLLAFLGVRMILESRKRDEEDQPGCDCGKEADIGFREMVVLAIATSIDALAVGISLAFLKVQIVPAVSFIGATTFLLSMLGVKIGNVFGVKYKSRAELVGGVILVGIGVKILIDHLQG